MGDSGLNNLLGTGAAIVSTIIALLILLVVYLVYVFSTLRLLSKVGEDNVLYKVLAWIPFLNMISLFRVAGFELGISILMLIGTFIPLINFIIVLFTIYKIAERLGYESLYCVLWTVGGIIPIVNMFVIPGLAFLPSPAERGTT